MKNIVVVVMLVFSFGKINAQTQKNNTYKLAISFISKGSGIDRKCMAKVDSLIKNYSPKPSYEICRQGREGETTYLFQLKELKKHEINHFVKEVKSQILDATMVLVEEDKHFEGNCR